MTENALQPGDSSLAGYHTGGGRRLRDVQRLSRSAKPSFRKRVLATVVDLRQSAAHRYSPAEVVAVARTAVQGAPAEISTSYVERSNLSLRMASRRFTRLTNDFSKKLENHAAAVSLYVAHYDLCRVHEAHRTTPALALGSRIMCSRLANCLMQR